MRIGIDLQGIQSEGSRTRGIGRYSVEIIRNLINTSKTDHFVLIANASLRNLEAQFKSELRLNNVSYFEWSAPCPFDYLSNNQSLQELALYLKSYSCACLYLDLVIITSFFEGFTDNCLTEFDRNFCNFKILSIFYDLIPMINPELYFRDNVEFERFYKNKLKKLEQVDALLAISESSLNEVTKYLNFDSNSLFNISSACDRKTFNTNRSIIPSSELNSILNIPFLLYTGAGDPRKNLRGLLEAYSLLPNRLKHFRLVLAGKLSKSEIELIDNWINLYKIETGKVIKTGFISDDDLVALYRSCYLFIFPSFHEGFGLPVLEAMSCGAPVIGSNTTSIPEVIGNNKGMFDPSDPVNIKQLIVKVLSNKDFRDELIISSKVQSDKFSWASTAEHSIKACHVILKNSQCINPHLSWDDVIRKNQSNQEKLFDRISQIKFLSKNSNDEIWKLIASSIDRINKQIDFLARGIFVYSSIKSWRVEGPFDSSYSLAKLNRLFAESLNKYISNLSLSITEGFGDYQPDIDYLRAFPLVNSIYLESANKTTTTEVISRNLYPPRVKDLNSRINILHSYGWEESKLPNEWVSDFNIYLQGMTVMSSQVKKILIDNGVKVPIQVSGLGLDHIDAIEADKEFIVQAKKYKILHISSCFPRKGVDILLKSYCDVFSAKDDVSLIIKTFINPHNNINKLVEEIKRNVLNAPDIIVLYDDITDQEIKSLMLQSNVLVAPSRGEGFGFPIGEAMRLGLPVVTTAWGGQLDFCTHQNSWLIDYKFVFSNSHFSIDQSYWAEPCREHLAELLHQIYYNEKSVLNAKLNEAKKTTDLLTWDLVAKNNIDFVQSKCLNYKPLYFKLGVLTTWNTKCGIASYSKNLFSNINEELVILSPFNEKKVIQGSPKIIPSWDLNNETQDFSFLSELIISENITTLFIQFNYGLFNFKRLSELIDTLVDKDINVVILLHSTIDPINNKAKKLDNLNNALSKCNRVFVHSLADLNRLKGLGITHNVQLLSHGIIDTIPNVNFLKTFYNKVKYNRIKRIASYGFCLPDKGYKQLIEAVGLLRQTDLKLTLTIFSAIYSNQYQYVYEELIQLISDLKLEKSVKVITNYISDEETINNLNQFDCLVFPYQHSNESSSAAVRQGLASLRPVLVSPLDIFSDVDDLVHHLPGFTPYEISDGIYQWFKTNELQIKKNKYRYTLLTSRRFSQIRRSLIDTLKSLEVNYSLRI